MNARRQVASVIYSVNLVQHRNFGRGDRASLFLAVQLTIQSGLTQSYAPITVTSNDRPRPTGSTID